MTVRELRNIIAALNLNQDAIIKLGGSYISKYLCDVNVSLLHPERLIFKGSMRKGEKICVKELLEVLENCEEDNVIYDEKGKRFFYARSRMDNTAIWLEWKLKF